MPEEMVVNYPDVLGYITGGERINISVVQLAITTQPRVIRAGKPFEMILLIQNASDIEIDVTATMKIPDRDSKGKKDRFVTKADRLIVGMKPAEVGYLTLPISTLPDTGVGSDYKIGVDVKVAPANKNKPGRIRNPKGGGDTNFDHLDQDVKDELEELKKLNYVTAASGLRGSTLQIGFTVVSGKVGAIADLKPGWKSLWTLKDHLDDRVLLVRFASTLREKILPSLHRDKTVPPLIEQTEKRFREAGYELLPVEASLIAKLMAIILKYAWDVNDIGMKLVAEQYAVMPHLDESALQQSHEPIKLPHWCTSLLNALNKDERIADYPIRALTHFAYIDLLRDAMDHAFDRVETATGQKMGSGEERNVYIDNLLTRFEEGEMTFDQVYMPLVLGGIIVYDNVLIGGEKPADIVHEMQQMLQQRASLKDEYNELIFVMAEQLVEQAYEKYHQSGW